MRRRGPFVWAWISRQPGHRLCAICGRVASCTVYYREDGTTRYCAEHGRGAASAVALVAGSTITVETLHTA